jgi:collagenase-like PrtC family protease
MEQATPPLDEIEVTPEMVQAGVDAFHIEGGVLDVADAREAFTSIYVAMRRIERRCANAP